jgi:tRNA1(Val) A37 N6-methylase TrmN6
MLRIRKITELAHLYLRLNVSEGDRVVDATAGNGLDTFFLASLVGTQGHVYAFDIQSEALAITKNKLSESGLCDRVSLICDGHEKLDLYVKEPVAAIIYNLGFLPGGDRDKTTKAETTLSSLGKALSLLKNRGLAVLVLYPGHREGKTEKDLLLKYCRKLSPRAYNVLNLTLINQPNEPPELVVIQRNLFSPIGDA